VLSDALALARQLTSSNGLFIQEADNADSDDNSLNIVPMSEVVSANYLRIPTVDRPGVFAQVTQALSEFSISIDAAIQHEAAGVEQPVDIVLLTDDVAEAAMIAALERLEGLDIVAADIVRIRVAPDF